MKVESMDGSQLTALHEEARLARPIPAFGGAESMDGSPLICHGPLRGGLWTAAKGLWVGMVVVVVVVLGGGGGYKEGRKEEGWDEK